MFWNPKGLVEQGNPNTCAETKLCLILFFIPAQGVVCYEPQGVVCYEFAITLNQLGLIRRRLFSTNKQRPLSLTKTNVFQNSRLTIDKNSLPRFAIAKRNQRYYLIRPIQIILPPSNQSPNTGAKNNYNTCQSTQYNQGSFAHALRPNQRSTRLRYFLSSRLKSSLYECDRASLYIYRPGWSNFCTLVGRFSKLFEFAGLNRLKTLIFVPNSGCSLKKKRSSIGIDLRNSFFRPKIRVFSKKKKVFNWNRSPKFLFSSQNHSVPRKKRLPLPVIDKTSAKLFRGPLKFHPRATCG